MKIGILKTDSVRAGLVEEFGEYPDMFIALLLRVDADLEFVIYDVQTNEYPRDIDEVDAYLITGSKAGVYDDCQWIRQLQEFVRTLHQARKKLIGICFGHQLIAHTLGGRAAKSGKGWGVGRHSYAFNAQAEAFAPEGSEFSVLVSHQDQVLEPATGATVLAGSDFCPVAMTQLDNHMLTFQGHPEFVPEYARKLLELRRSCIGEERYQHGMSSLHEPLDQRQLARWILDFVHR